MVVYQSSLPAVEASKLTFFSGEPLCAGYKGHPFNKSLFDHDDYAFQAPLLRTDALSSQHRLSIKPLSEVEARVEGVVVLAT